MLLGDKGVGKTTFLDGNNNPYSSYNMFKAITSNFGKIVESEQSSELTTRV